MDKDTHAESLVGTYRGYDLFRKGRGYFARAQDINSYKADLMTAGAATILQLRDYIDEMEAHAAKHGANIG